MLFPTGNVVAGGFVYKTKDSRLFGRFRVERANRSSIHASFISPDCTVDLIDEAGAVTTIHGTADPADLRFVVFDAVVALSFPQNYIARVKLAPTDFGNVGPRTFALPVS